MRNGLKIKTSGTSGTIECVWRMALPRLYYRRSDILTGLRTAFE